MKLFGTTTSPYVRRVRVVADEVGQPMELINTATDVGQASLREITPIRKVPVAVIDGRTIFDSRAITDWLVTTRGWHSLAPPRDAYRMRNIGNAIDTALDSVIQLFYLRRDGVAVAGTVYEKREMERAAAIFEWLGGELVDRRTFEGAFGLAELALVTALDWMDFRKTYPTERHDTFSTMRLAWKTRPSLEATMPHT